MQYIKTFTSVVTALLAGGCGGGDTSSIPADSADPFGGTFEIRLIPTRIDCFYADASMQIAVRMLSGTGTVINAPGLTEPNLSITGNLTFASGASTAQVVARASNGSGYTIQFGGTAFRIVDGIALSGSYSDSFGCDGTWRSS